MSTRVKDYYRILQVHPDAEPEVVEAAYRRLAQKYHPGRDPSPGATRRMQELNEAYGILADAERRRAYDLLRSSPAADAAKAPASQKVADRALGMGAVAIFASAASILALIWAALIGRVGGGELAVILIAAAILTAPAVARLDDRLRRRK